MIILDEELENKENVAKERHGCVTSWLVLMIIINSLTSIVYLFYNETITQNLPSNFSQTYVIIYGIGSFGNIVFAILLLQWKKIGFWGFFFTSFVVLGLNISMGIAIWQCLFGFIGIAFLYAILQVKQNDVSAWDHLE